jgi:hypothetical protein
MEVQSVKFLYQDLPTCPFIWTYNGFMFQLKSALKVTCNEFADKLPTELKNMLKKYKCDYYLLEQEIPIIDDKIINIANVSFHSWLFSKFNNGYGNMSDSKLNTQIMSCLIPLNTTFVQVGKYGIEINSFGKRRLHIHNGRLSPKYDNAIKLNGGQNEFITICIHEKSKLCCVTHHILS